MKRFIIATIIFIIVDLAGILLDACFLYVAWEAMPNLLYYTFGWLAAGTYVAITKSKNK